MSKKNPSQPGKQGGGLMGRILRRFLLVFFTIVILAVAALCLVLNLVFNGPSTAARDMLTMSLIEASATKWVPKLFIGEDAVAEIRTSVNVTLEEDLTDTSMVQIGNYSTVGGSDEWENYPNGIRIEHIQGLTYNAHVMLVQDPSRVYMGLSTYDGFSTAKEGKRINYAIEDENAIAAINAGAFNDDGTLGTYNGSCPLGLVMSGSKCVWESGKQPGLEGFAGFTEDNILVVSQKNLTKEEAEAQSIRDGCCFGPALIINGEVNPSAYNDKSGLNPRTAIGQRADGTVIFVCVDGRQAGSLGGTYADVINIMQEYGAVNACNMDGGSSSIMMYRDVEGRYWEAGEVQFVNSPSLIQAEPRRMPNFWIVRPAD